MGRGSIGCVWDEPGCRVGVGWLDWVELQRASDFCGEIGRTSTHFHELCSCFCPSSPFVKPVRFKGGPLSRLVVHTDT